MRVFRDINQFSFKRPFHQFKARFRLLKTVFHLLKVLCEFFRDINQFSFQRPIPCSKLGFACWKMFFSCWMFVHYMKHKKSWENEKKNSSNLWYITITIIVYTFNTFSTDSKTSCMAVQFDTSFKNSDILFCKFL